MLLCLSDPSSPNQRATHFQFLCPTAHPQDLQPPLLLYLGLSPINPHLPRMRCLKRDMILQLKHEQKICFECLAHSTLPYKDQYKFHCQQCHAATKQMNKWLALNSWGTIKPLYRTVIHTVIFPIPPVNYNYFLLGLCTSLEEKWNQQIGDTS